MIELSLVRTGLSFVVRVQPRASQEGVRGEYKGALKVAVHAPPEGGKANHAVIALLAELLGVTKSAIEVTAGHATRTKRIRVTCSSPQTVAARVQQAGDGKR